MVPASQLRETDSRVRELERLSVVAQRVRAVAGQAMTVVCHKSFPTRFSAFSLMLLWECLRARRTHGIGVAADFTAFVEEHRR